MDTDSNVINLSVYHTASFQATWVFGTDFMSDSVGWSLSGFIYNPSTGPSTPLVAFTFSALTPADGGGWSSSMTLTAAQVSALTCDGKTFADRTTLNYQVDATAPDGAVWRVCCGNFVLIP